MSDNSDRESGNDETIKRSGAPLRKASSLGASPSPKPPAVKRKGTSGDHPIMQEVRRKLDSIREGTLPELEALNARIDKIKRKSDPPFTTGASPAPEPDDEDGDTIPTIEAPKAPA